MPKFHIELGGQSVATHIFEVNARNLEEAIESVERGDHSPVEIKIVPGDNMKLNYAYSFEILR